MKITFITVPNTPQGNEGVVESIMAEAPDNSIRPETMKAVNSFREKLPEFRAKCKAFVKRAEENRRKRKEVRKNGENKNL